MEAGLQGYPQALLQTLVDSLQTPFVSAGNASYSATTITVAHGLTSTPTIVRVVLVCASSELGFSVGDEVDVAGVMDNNIGSSTDLRPAYLVTTSSTAVMITYSNAINTALIPYFLRNRSTGAAARFTAASWTLKIIAKV